MLFLNFFFYRCQFSGVLSDIVRGRKILLVKIWYKTASKRSNLSQFYGSIDW